MPNLVMALPRGLAPVFAVRETQNRPQGSIGVSEKLENTIDCAIYCPCSFLGVLTRILAICWTRGMARRTPDARLESRESRSRLASRGKPHYRLLEPGLHIGYRRLKGRKGRPAVAGTWVARHYIGGQCYVIEKIGIADDFSDADGIVILSFAQAQDKARARMVKRVHEANGVTGPLTVKAVV